MGVHVYILDHIYICMKKRNYYIKKQRDTSPKWVQKEGRTMDDITFTNGEVEVNFDERLENYYKKY